MLRHHQAKVHPHHARYNTVKSGSSTNDIGFTPNASTKGQHRTHTQKKSKLLRGALSLNSGDIRHTMLH